MRTSPPASAIRRASRARAACGITLADDPAYVAHDGRQPLHVRPALLLVGVEQGVAGSSCQHQRELPGQVCDVAHALAHALPGERRLLVRRVSGEEHSSTPPLARHERVEPVARGAPQRRIVRSDPAREQPPHLRLRLHRPRVLAGQQHDLPAAVIPGADQKAARARRLAVMDARPGQPRGAALVHQRIDDQPGLVEFEILVLNAEQAADSARCAVAADDVARIDRATISGVIAQLQRNAVGRLRQLGELGAEGDLHGVLVRRAPAQRGLDRRLVEDHARRPAQRVGRRHHTEALDEPAVCAVILRRRKRRHVGRDGLRRPRGSGTPA